MGLFIGAEIMFDLKIFDELCTKHEKFFLAACDEVGRGPLAGPVVGASLVLEILSDKKLAKNELKKILHNWKKFGITDSKKLNPKERINILLKLNIKDLDQVDSLRANQNYQVYSTNNLKMTVNIQEVSALRIDEINILQASLEAMKLAMFECAPIKKSGLVLIDGNKKLKFESKTIDQMTVVKGDSKSLLIGLASIFAKEYRDNLMKKYALLYPSYGWEQNAGYPTKRHLGAILEYGVTELHRTTFKGVKEVYEERGVL